MKTGSASLKNTLYTASQVAVADLVTFYFPAGAQRFTNASTDLTIGGNVYTSAHVSEIGLLQGLGVEVETLEFQFGIANQVVGGQGFLTAAIAGEFDNIRVEITRAVSATGTFAGYLAADLLTIFDGRCIDVVPTSKTQITFRIKSALALATTPVSNRTVIAQCPYSLGGPGCGVNLATFTDARTVAAGSTRSLVKLSSASSFAATGSVLTVTSGALAGQSRVVRSVSVADVTLDFPLAADPEVGATVTIARACGKTHADCQTIFSNLVNFGGFPYAPVD